MKCANCYNAVAEILAPKEETIRQQQAEIDRLTHIIESVKPYLAAAAADGSMSRNNSEQLAAELIAEIEASNE